MGLDRLFRQPLQIQLMLHRDRSSGQAAGVRGCGPLWSLNYAQQPEHHYDQDDDHQNRDDPAYSSPHTLTSPFGKILSRYERQTEHDQQDNDQNNDHDAESSAYLSSPLSLARPPTSANIYPLRLQRNCEGYAG